MLRDLQAALSYWINGSVAEASLAAGEVESNYRVLERRIGTLLERLDRLTLAQGMFIDEITRQRQEIAALRAENSSLRGR